jgi:chitin disaccharide deacetylase
LELECRMQIEKALSRGISITHLDSHKHLHFFGEFREIITKLAQEYGIMRVRCINEVPFLCSKKYGLFWFLRRKHYNALFLNICSRVNKALADKQGIKTADYSYGVNESRQMTEQKYRNIFSCLKNGTTEIICHPGYEDRRAELDALLSPGFKELLHKLGVKLISYNGL